MPIYSRNSGRSCIVAGAVGGEVTEVLDEGDRQESTHLVEETPGGVGRPIGEGPRALSESALGEEKQNTTELCMILKKD